MMTGGRDRPLALVTGGARRVGLASVLELARSGCDVIIHYRSSAGEARAAAELVRALGAGAHTAQADLGNAAEVESLAERVRKDHGRLDVLVHNASSYDPTPLEEVDAEAAWSAFGVNALGPLLLTRGTAALLADSTMPGGGAVVAMCDIHAMGIPRKNFVCYAMSKAALAEMVRSLAIDLAPRVRVNGVAPGVVEWPETGHESDEAAQRAYLSRVPLGRSGTPEDAARAVRWLALEATYLTGQIVRVDGGRSLR